MWSAVSQIRQPHDVTETNIQTGENKSDLEQLYLRAQSLSKVAMGILAITAHKVTGRNTKGAPYSMISEPIRLAEALPINDEGESCDLIKLCIGFSNTEHKEIERGKLLQKTRVSYVPDFDNVTNVGVIYLADDTGNTDPRHEGSAHWYRTDSPNPEVFDAIEQGIEAVRNTLGRLTTAQTELAS